ncbi:ATP-grasp domain-containing protein [Kordiimonas lacus]|uniref:Glutathione synthetase, ATP-grasp domain n=1 Tax=Kordiimonas lacus TaxID=637679 RepID=A0A1G6VPG2_9PROT|nr:hypothetical protein [Kordiimonas lacus]SDD54716.1 hypothetical protein SAMN04488071_0785 [Kordiimonas lacus]
MHLCFLSSRVTMPGSPVRRVDAFEHDQMMENLTAAFEARGGRVTDVSWDDKDVDWSTFDAVMIGTTWDYWDRLDEFLETLEKIETQTRLYNASALVRWNIDKRYLRDLEGKGAALIPTIWADKATPEVIAEAFETFGAEKLVAKRQVGAGADGQHMLKRGDAVPEMPHPMMIQPFMDAIVDEGELSFIFIGGKLSHTLLKTAAKGDYRIQSAYGGQETPVDPAPEDVAQAAKVLAAAPVKPLYARVDMIRGEDGSLCLMEMELIEPFLYPLQGPELGARIYEALKG